ncbi:MAG TPA: sigma-70 family RNA polymerase sigma factor [Planctomycetota bacterium]|nr:sigma-70 family RNA polymerase sigma factor [Planctomycetota bacterium]
MEGELELLARAKKGSREAFERLLTPYLPMLFAYGRSICGDYHAAQDVVQETAIIAFRNLDHLFPEADFPTWLRAITRRQALEARRKRPRLARFAEEAIERTYQDPAPPAVTVQKSALADCMHGLGDRVRVVIQEHYFKGEKLSSVASRLRMTQPAVKQLLYRARRLLEECVKKRLGTEAAS